MVNFRPDGHMSMQNEGYGAYPGGPPPGGGESSAGGLSIGQVGRIMKDRWWMVVLAMAISFGAAWYLVPDDQSMYQAAAVLRIQDTRSDVTAGMVSGTQGDSRGVEYMLSQIHVIRSAALVGEVVDAQGLRFAPNPELPLAYLSDISVNAESQYQDTLWIRFADDGFVVQQRGVRQVQGRYGQPVELGDVRFTVLQAPTDVAEAGVAILSRQEAIARVTARLNPLNRSGSAILDISYSDTDPTRARQVVNAVAQVYRTYNTVGQQERARLRREFLQEQLLEAEGTLARAQQVLRDFQAADRSFGSVQRLQSETATLLALDTERRNLENERRVYQSFLESIQRAQGEQIDLELRTLMAAPGVASGPLLAQLYNQLNGYQLERDRMLASGRSLTHPDVEQLTLLINSNRAAIADAARTQVASLDFRIETLDDQRNRSSVALRSIPETGTEEVRLLEDVDNSRSMLSALRADFQRARLAETLEVSQAEVLDYATYAIPLVVGTRQRALIIALVFGLFLGGGGALLLESTNSFVRGRDELEGILSVPGLGVIPRIEMGKAASSGRALPSKVGAANRDGNGIGPDPTMYVGRLSNGNGAHANGGKSDLQEFHTMAAEAYRMLRTNLVFLMPDREMRTLVVTSAASGEGKTTTAANLAVAFARQGKRVLLVDCDLRRPRLHTMFGIEQKPGFCDLLLGNATGAEAIHPTNVDRLFLLPRGEFDERAAEMLSGTAGSQLIAKLRDHWDLVIFDTSPVLLTADAAAVAPNTDGALLVVRAGKTSREAAKQAMQQLLVVGAPVLGFVLNDPDAVGERYGENKYAKEYYTVQA